MFESLNLTPEDVYLNPTTKEDEEHSKRHWLGDGYQLFVSREENTLQNPQLGCTTKDAHDNSLNILGPSSPSK